MNFNLPMPTDFEKKQNLLAYSDDQFENHLKRRRLNTYKLCALEGAIALTMIIGGYVTSQSGWSVDGGVSCWFSILGAAFNLLLIITLVYCSKNQIFTSLKTIDPGIQTGGIFETLKKVRQHSEWAQAWRDHVEHNLKRELYGIDAKLMLALANNERSMKWRTLAYGDKAKPYRSLNRDSYVGPGRNDNFDVLLARLNRLLY